MRSVVGILVLAGLLFDGQPILSDRRFLLTSGDEQSAEEADRALAGALEKGDPRAAGSLLDDKFQWTDVDGKTRSKTEVLGNLALLVASSRADTDVKSRLYGQLALIYGFHHGARFSRIWVKRPHGWRAMVYLDTRIPQRTVPSAVPGMAGDCENPCRTVPYTPATDADKAVLAEWQKTKMDEWHPDVRDWETHLAEEFLIISSNSERSKAERVAIARQQQEAGLGMPGDPVMSMSMSDFGDAVLMFSEHFPYRGGKPYYSVRLFVKRDGHWLLAWSQQTTLQMAEPRAAVADRK